MPHRNSTLKPQPNITPTLRKSPRFLLNNQPHPLDPQTPEPRLRACRLCTSPSPLSSVDEGIVEKVHKKIGKSKRGSMNLGKLNNGLNRSGVVKPGFCVRRSPRLSGKESFTDGSLEKEVSNRKEGKGLSYLGRMGVGFDSGSRDEGRSVIKERVTRSLVRRNADDIVKKESNSKKGVPDEERAIACFDLSKQAECKSVIEKRVTRSSTQRNADETAKKSNQCKKGLSDTERAKKGFDLGQRTVREIKIEKRVTRGSIRGCAVEITEEKCKEDLLGIERSLLGAESCNSIGGKLNIHPDDGANSGVDFRGKEMTQSCGAPSMVIHKVNAKDRDIGKGTQTIGVKRKRNQDGENHEWSQDEELALQRAYFAAKPTPNFWKRVAKLIHPLETSLETKERLRTSNFPYTNGFGADVTLANPFQVPGKSAQDCFNKVHSDSLTPPQHRPRSRATNRTMPSFSLSASKLLKREELKMGKKTSQKQKNHLAQKTVRQLLQKHYNMDQGHEADLFSILEPSFNPSTKSLESDASYSTPQCGKGQDKSSLARKKTFSRFGSSNGKVFVSPPVLKPIKNKALHEKYIDQLHRREAKRRVGCKKENPKKVLNQKTEAIKVLKDSLVLDAKDFIHKFQHREDRALKEYSDDDDENEFLEDDGEDNLE